MTPKDTTALEARIEAGDGAYEAAMKRLDNPLRRWWFRLASCVLIPWSFGQGGWRRYLFALQYATQTNLAEWERNRQLSALRKDGE